MAGAYQIPPAMIGADLPNYAYPFPVKWFEARACGSAVRMAYMDVAPTHVANGHTLVLLHGKEFTAASWGETIRALTSAGYRVIAPDQIGFGKSSKPASFQYSFAALATLTQALLQSTGVDRFRLVGHSTGGVLAMRYGLLYPDRLDGIVLVNPLGLVDTLAQGAPYTPIDALLQEEAKTNRDSIAAYERKNYYHGGWRPEYDEWVDVLAGQYAGEDAGVVQNAQARITDMIETQPVASELPRLALPVTLLIGQLDATAVLAATAPADVRPHIATVPQAAETAVTMLPRGRLVRLEGLGHAPQIEDPSRFQAELLAVLN